MLTELGNGCIGAIIIMFVIMMCMGGGIFR